MMKPPLALGGIWVSPSLNVFEIWKSNAKRGYYIEERARPKLA